MDLKSQLLSTIRNVPNFPKEGVQYKDIMPVLESPDLCKDIISELIRLYRDVRIDAVAGIESRGFLFGLPLAMYLNVPFIALRKKGKLPAETVSYVYALEYGTAEIEMHKGIVRPGMNVLIHDDLLATGGTACAGAELIKMEGGSVAGFTFLIELAFLRGRERLISYKMPVNSLIIYES